MTATAMNRVVGDALLSRRTDARWSVTCVEYPKGLALLQRTGPMTRVIVADSANTFAGPEDPDAYSAAVCTPDGELALVVHHSPPAIVVGSTGCRTRPAEGACRDCVRLNPGERLLLLSGAAFEALPPVLADGLSSSAADLAHCDPEDLLLEIFREVGHGAGAAIDHLLPPVAGAASAH